MSEVGKFEEALQQHKDILVKELIKLGKNRQAEFVVWDIEKNQVDYEYYFQAGRQSRQARVEELQKKIEIMQEKINEVIDYVGDEFDDFYLGETNSDIHKILTVDLEQALKVDTNE
ncbi:hypothetical protein AB9_013 [Acinetobacter phage vB_AbaM_B9]|nr:hypothetical protein AB9_013 [Acinetobacter phage vB_AbaM_B9]